MVRITRIAEVADGHRDGDVEHVVTETTTVWPTTGNGAIPTEFWLHFAGENVAAEDAQAGESGVIGARSAPPAI